MLTTLIHNWIVNSGPFSEGLELYRQVKGGLPVSYFDRQLFQPYINPYVKKELTNELQEYLDRNPLQKSPTSPSFQYSKEPVEIKNLRDAAKKLHKRHSFLHAKLTSADNDEKRLLIAKEIMEVVIPGLDQTYLTIRTFENTGILPSTPGEDSTALKKGALMYKRMESLRPRISRVKKWLRSGKRGKKILSSVEMTAYQEEVEAKEAEIQSILKALGL